MVPRLVTLFIIFLSAASRFFCAWLAVTCGARRWHRRKLCAQRSSGRERAAGGSVVATRGGQLKTDKRRPLRGRAAACVAAAAHHDERKR